ncbi:MULTISPECIES: IS1096 element passenger TnpR family protein [Pseudomonas]|jgi:hypothetical protein|uniref:IS1096 element passenger TnpR family protein n=1 Tax=Pseudomonas TaxID=286 RepID=UPI000483AB77|nr:MULTISPECIES: hypothetical protein [Pseudomonas]KAA8553946.1 hypothetical protein FX984_00557 [Pseudomonas marginalis]NMZ94381.1 plasmid pRiA4b ORF-3 family protein [Pseudomonas marginalis]PUB48033.1 pRiA4b ORF-3-like protein [Pseudomonas sp. GV047]TWR73030.1 plasmid pRiA4b ORF-3 family protein [Pseudomonas marginalis]SCX24957.1 pRiA4b ORF-3-like protein [Pseudomonas sp. NFACC25]
MAFSDDNGVFAFACRPLEDIGGAPGHDDFLAALADPNHPEHEAMSEWYGDDGFDPTAFDCEWINQRLKQAKV